MADVVGALGDESNWSDAELSMYVRDTLHGELGAKIDYDPVYAELYRLDFVINRFEGVHALVNLGVRTTLATENYAEQERFLEASKKGVVHNLIYDEERGEFVTNLNEASADVKVAAKDAQAIVDDVKGLVADVKAGKGTVGALLVDPTVYEDLKVLLGNARTHLQLMKRSIFLRSD